MFGARIRSKYGKNTVNTGKIACRLMPLCIFSRALDTENLAFKPGSAQNDAKLVVLGFVYTTRFLRLVIPYLGGLPNFPPHWTVEVEG